MKNAIVERLLYITLMIVFVAACIFAYLAISATDRFNRQQVLLKQQIAQQQEVLKGIKEVAMNQGKTTAEINKSLSCMMIFLGVPDRADYSISDLSTCTITNTNTGQSRALPIPKPPAPMPIGQSSAVGGSQQGPPSISGGNAAPPTQDYRSEDDRSATEKILDSVTTSTTGLTCGLIGVLCR